MNATVKLHVNDARLVRNLSLAFANRTTFVAELMQNARRAGATLIKIETKTVATDPAVEMELVMEDNGGGISSWQDLLSLADSGWSAEIKGEEHPYGMGFFSCISAAKRVKIESLDQMMEFDRDEVMNFNDIEITQGTEHVQGTRITLSGLPHIWEIDNAIKSFSIGFPVAVLHNGAVLDQSLSVQALKANESLYESVEQIEGIGLCAFRKPAELWKHGCRNLGVFLLGIPIVPVGRSTTEIIHLDPAKFPAKMPDRDVLIDQDAKLKFIADALTDWWLNRMLWKKENVSLDTLLDTEPVLMLEMFKAGILNDINRIPGFVFEKVPAFSLSSWRTDFFTGDKFDEKWLSQADIESGKITICESLCDDHFGKQAAAHTLAHDLGWGFSKLNFHEDHWLHAHVVNLRHGVESLVIKFDSLETDHCMVSRREVNIHLCNGVTIEWNGFSSELTNTPVVYTADDDYDDMTLLMPTSCHAGAAIEMIDMFQGEDSESTDSDFQAECEETLRMRLLSMKKGCPSETLMAYLSDTDYAYQRNTKNTCVLLVNPGVNRRLHANNLSSMNEALIIFRKQGIDGEGLKDLLEEMMNTLAKSAKYEEEEELKRDVCRFLNEYRRDEYRLDLSVREQLVNEIIDKFRDEVIGFMNWEYTLIEVEEAVKAAVDKLASTSVL